MPLRHYLAQIVGDGQSLPTAFRPVFVDLLPGVPFTAVDGRADGTLTSGWMLVGADVTSAQHATLVQDARVRYLPMDDDLDLPIRLDDLLEKVPLTKRQSLRDVLEGEHTPTHDLGTSSPGRALLQRLIRRCVMRQGLGALDITEGLDTLWGDIPAQRRKEIADRLEVLGYDTSVLALSDTIRSVQAALSAQPVPRNRTHLD